MEINPKSAMGHKERIQNRKRQNIITLVEKAKDPKGLAFVMHGLGGFKEQVHLKAITEVLKECSYTVVRFDTTNTLGESDGSYEDATTSNYYEDLEDVIGWTAKQLWYQEPFVLVGHSLGGISVGLFAERYPEKVKGLAPISTVVSGRLSIEAQKHYEPKKFKEWERTGWGEEDSRSKPGVIKRLRWSHVADRLKYDLIPEVEKLTMPVLLIVGENDMSTPPEHQKLLYDALIGPKEYHIIRGAEHTFREPAHLEELKKLFRKWVQKL